MKATPVAEAVAQVAEHHGLHVDRRAPAVGDAVQAAIGLGAGVVPGAEHGGDRAPQLLGGVLRERLAGLALHRLLVGVDDLEPVVGAELGVEREPAEVLVVLEDVLEHAVVDAQHDVGIHLDEAAVAVVGEARVARLGGQALHRLVVEAEVEDGVHHARHRRARARAHRDQQRRCGRRRTWRRPSLPTCASAASTSCSRPSGSLRPLAL